jgi:hypothetical protein
MCIQVNNVTAIGDYNTLKPFPSTPFIAFINNLCTTCTTNQLDFYRTPQVQNNWYLGMTFEQIRPKNIRLICNLFIYHV